MSSDELITSHDDVIAMLDRLLGDPASARWDKFYSDRKRPCSFFVPHPDESLVGYVSDGRLEPGRALELGCGNGRNALYLARSGFTVEAIDFSATAIEWAEERARDQSEPVRFVRGSIFEHEAPATTYQLVYDAGCFHHLAPHRRPTYLQLVRDALPPGGRFGLVCFTPEGGCGLNDREVYEEKTLGGGLGFSEAQLRRVFEPWFEIDELRPMRKMDAASELFGEDFLWSVLMRRRAEPSDPGAVPPDTEPQP